MVAQKTGNTVYYFEYDLNGAPFLLYKDGISYYYILNGQGDVIAITDASGNVVTEYTYDPWGNILSVTGSLASTIGADNPLRYRGYFYDSETGLYYLNSRYYDPVTGRFLNADRYAATGQGVLGYNMFAYCGNNPIHYSDPTGHTWVDAFTDKGTGNKKTINRQKRINKIERAKNSDNYLIPTIGISGNFAFGVAASYNTNLALDTKTDKVYAMSGVGLGGGGIGVSPAGVSIGLFDVQSIDSLKDWSYTFSINVLWFGFQFVVINDTNSITSYGYVLNFAPIPSLLSVDAQIAYETKPFEIIAPPNYYWEIGV